MCGRFSLITVSEFISNRFNVTVESELMPRYNIAPSQEVPIIMNTASNKITMARWGLIPNWAKDKNIGYKMINARAETLLEKPAYQGPFRNKRCIIPADGFYEWKKTNRQKIPYRITLKDSQLFAFAGLYDVWEHNEQKVLSCTIITTSPNRLVAKIHDRMPAMLRKEHESVWLTEMDPEKLLTEALRPYPPEDMKSFRISELVNSPGNNTEEVIKPVRSLLDY